ncbi:L,D-transpeptidase [Shimia sp. NS0008-38b]|uniref:L,D-transpeptidase n=1 Tax=Shimia sp. NS0008-38b TaxID=3127653 RepID=UPI003106AFBB
MQRRHFLAGTASLLATPQILRAAQGDSFELMEHLKPKEVRVKKKYGFQAGQLVVVLASYHLYHMMDERNAVRYGVAIGQEGLNFKGRATIERKVEWPSWRPTQEMIERNPAYEKYADGMKGGPTNPLGSRAMYLYQDGRDTLFRIHGTTAPQSIGTPSSNGCIRMVNEHIEYLYEQVPMGSEVIVFTGREA